MKTMFKTMLPLGLLLVFALSGYSQNNTTVTAKETKTNKTATCCGKVADKNCTGVFDNNRNCVQGNENLGCCEQGNNCGSRTGNCSTSCKSNTNCNGSRHPQGSGNQNNTPAKTPAPPK
ncbi:MAG: hypothetical protein ABSE72_03365 [Bacteroidales bacterium]